MAIKVLLTDDGSYTIDIASTLKMYREKKGLTQRELAESCGITPTSISRYETGARTPNFIEMVKIAEVLNMSLDIFKRK